MPESGHIELERVVGSILVGVRHRQDLGDLVPLTRSVQRLGLLQPITIAPDGTLLCGRRRLEVIRQLEWRTVKVWVRSGISDGLNSLLAQQDENLLHKPLSLIEAAALYAELKVLLAEDGARRQRATQFGADPQEAITAGTDGGAESAPPSRPGKTRNQAAEVVTGSAAHGRLEQVNHLRDVAADEQQPEAVRDLAGQALGSIRAGGPVNPWAKEVAQLTRGAARRASDEELARLAHEAVERINTPVKRRSAPVAPRRKRPTRAFVHTWTDMDGWSARYDAAEIGTTLTDEEWALFERVHAETSRFHEAAKQARFGSTHATASVASTPG